MYHKLMRFPDWKDKAMTLSYDDAVIYDERLIQIMQKYGLKGTFNVNGGCFARNARRMDEETAVRLYQNSGMEVAMHGFKHLTLTACNNAEIMNEFYQDKVELEKLFGVVMRGGAYAFGAYNDESVRVLQSLGVSYFRTVKSTHSFDIPTDWLQLNPTCHHKDNIMELLAEFVGETEKRIPFQSKIEKRKAKLFYMFGHSFEFNDDNNWELIEGFGAKVAEYDDIWHATNSEIYDYVKAYDNLIFTAKGDKVLNLSPIDVYLWIDGQNVLAKANATTAIDLDCV